MTQWQTAQAHFRTVDPELARQADQLEIPEPQPADSLFHSLADIIVGQQLSNKAAETIFARLLAAVDATTLTPEHILGAEESVIRGAGISGAKFRALTAISTATQAGQLEFSQISQMDDDGVRRTLTALKGVGPWTAEMFLMFALAREDVFSLGDGGLQRAMMRLLKTETFDPAATLERSTRWAPYRTYAARTLWRALDQKLF